MPTSVLADFGKGSAMLSAAEITRLLRIPKLKVFLFFFWGGWGGKKLSRLYPSLSISPIQFQPQTTNLSTGHSAQIAACLAQQKHSNCFLALWRLSSAKVVLLRPKIAYLNPASSQQKQWLIKLLNGRLFKQRRVFQMFIEQDSERSVETASHRWFTTWQATAWILLLKH